MTTVHLEKIEKKLTHRKFIAKIQNCQSKFEDLQSLQTSPRSLNYSRET